MDNHPARREVMKVQNFVTLSKGIGRVLLVLSIASLGFVGCSKSKNKAPEGGSGTQPPVIDPIPNPNPNPNPTNPVQNVSSQIGQVLSTIPCQQGGQRIQADFNIQGSNPIAEYQPGLLNTSATTETYIGKSVFGDIMVVQKLGTNSSVQGYNASFYMCPYSSNSSYGGQVPLVMAGRPITRMKILQPGENGSGTTTFALATSKVCSIDQITVAEVKMEVGAFQNFQAAPIVTTFYPVNYGNNYQSGINYNQFYANYANQYNNIYSNGQGNYTTMPISGVCQ